MTDSLIHSKNISNYEYLINHWELSFTSSMVIVTGLPLRSLLPASVLTAFWTRPKFSIELEVYELSRLRPPNALFPAGKERPKQEVDSSHYRRTEKKLRQRRNYLRLQQMCRNSNGLTKVGGKKSIITFEVNYIGIYWGRVDDLSFFDYLSPFCYLNFIVLFPFLIQFYQIMFIILFRLGSDRLSVLLLFVPAVLFFILTPLFCPSSSVSLSYFILAVPMRECLGKHSCMSSPLSLTDLRPVYTGRF